jgi:transketolase
MMARYHQQYPELAVQWDLYVKGELPVQLEEILPSFSAEKPLATRVASGQVLSAIAPHYQYAGWRVCRLDTQ